MTGKDAVEKMEAGAQLVQLFTGFIYNGPEVGGRQRRSRRRLAPRAGELTVGLFPQRLETRLRGRVSSFRESSSKIALIRRAGSR